MDTPKRPQHSRRRRTRTSLNSGLARARAAALVVVEPTPKEVQIDLDGPHALRIYTLQRMLLDRHGLTHGWRTRIVPSRTRGHCHVIVTLPRRATLRERVLLATLLGSDRVREVLNYARIVTRGKYPVCLFRRKDI